MSNITAILLAAGKSSRMGRLKPLLPWGSGIVIDSCIKYLRDGGVEHIVVVLGHRATEISEAISDRNVLLAINELEESEMGVSIAQGVEQSPFDCEAFIVALTDQPAISPQVVSKLIATWSEQRPPLVVPEYCGRGGHPVLIDANLRSRLLDLDASGGLRGLVSEYRDRLIRVPVDSPFIVRDIDTWKDYQDLHLENFGFPPRAERG